MKIQSVHILPFINYAIVRGVSRKKFLSIFPGLDVNDGNRSVTMQQFGKLLDLIQSEIDDDKLALHVGRSLDFATLGVIHQISLKSKTIEEGLYYCHSFLQRTFPHLTIKNKVVGKNRRVKLMIDGFSPPHSRIILETTMMVMQRELQLMWNRRLKIECTSPYWDLHYPSNWRLGEIYSLRFLNKIDAEIRDYSSLRLDLLLPAYLKYLENLDGKRSFVSRVKVATLSLAAPSLPRETDVAAQFNCNVRGFQRILARDGTTYRELLNELKSELSLLLLRHEAFSVADIASFLGYSESAAFVRTFIKWYKISPAKYRKLKF